MFETRELEINMGPQHPSTHGVLRLILKLDGETVVDVDCDIGYLHRGVEKLAEHREYFQALNEDWEMISYKVNELISQRDRVVVLADVCLCHRQTGRLVATLKADVFRLRDGRIVEFCEFFDSATAVEAADESSEAPWPDATLSGEADL